MALSNVTDQIPTPWSMEPVILSPFPMRNVLRRVSPLLSELMEEMETPLLKRSRDEMASMSPVLAADIIEGDKDFHVQIDLPGIELDKLEVSLSGGRYLVITAERKRMEKIRPSRPGPGDFSYGSERIYGVVQRTIAIPSGADIDTAEAQYDSGVLTVRFAKKEGDGVGTRKLLVKEPRSADTCPKHDVHVTHK